MSEATPIVPSRPRRGTTLPAARTAVTLATTGGALFVGP